MTTINDLPPELLYRILHLAAEGEGYRRQVILQDTSAVARSWRSSSQELLLTEVSLSAVHPAKTVGFAARLKDFRLREVRRLTVDRFTKDDMQVATEGIRSLGCLRIEGDHAPFPAGCLSVKLLSGTLLVKPSSSSALTFPPPHRS